MNKKIVIITIFTLCVIAVGIYFTLSIDANADDENPLCFTAINDESSVGYMISGSLPEINVQYSYDENSWNDWNGNKINLENGEKLYVRNTVNHLSMGYFGYNYLQFIMSGKIVASGNVNSMINNASLTPYCFYGLFSGCESLTVAPELPATELAESCYEYIFCGCSSLTTAPELPATTLAPYCYFRMFSSCYSLTTAPELPATELAVGCYSYMFRNCTSLTTAPKLPAETLVENCYNSMFYNCWIMSIVCYATDITAKDCVKNWLLDNPRGFFYSPNEEIWAGKIPDRYRINFAVIDLDEGFLSTVPEGWELDRDLCVKKVNFYDKWGDFLSNIDTPSKNRYLFSKWDPVPKESDNLSTVQIIKAIWIEDPSPTPSNDNNNGLIIGIVAGVIAAIAIIGIAVYFVRKK